METIRYLRIVAQKELRVEHCRIELGNDEQFEPYQLYCTMSDENGLNYKQMQQLLDLNREHSQYLCRYLGSQGFISFQKLVLPQSDDFLNYQVSNRFSQRKNYDVKIEFSVIDSFQNLLEAMIKGTQEINNAQKTMGRNVKQSFYELDRNKVGYIRFEDFELLSREINSFMPPEEIITLFRLADIDRDCRLSFNEFKLLFDQEDDGYSSKDFLYTNQNGILDQDDQTRTTKKVNSSLPKPRYVQFEGTTEKKFNEYPQSNTRYGAPKINTSEWNEYQPEFQRDVMSSPRDQTNELDEQYKINNNVHENIYLDDIQNRYLSELLTEQIIMEKQITDVKNSIVMEADYTISNLWTFFNQNKSLNITKQVFSQKLKDIGINFIEVDFDSLIRQYDSSGKGLQLKIEDLNHMMMPQVNDYRSLLNSRQQQTAGLSSNTLSLIRELIETHFWIQNVKRTMMQNFVNRQDFNLDRVFRLICDHESGRVTKKSLQRFLWKQGIFTGHADVLSVLSIYDIDKDGEVGIDEFQQSLESAFQ